MPTRPNPFVFGVSDLLHSPGKRRPELIEEVVDYGVELSRTASDRPLTGELELEGVSGGVMVTGRVVVGVHHRCNRCLREWTEDLAVEIRQPFTSDVQSDYVVAGEVIDVEPLLRDEVTLALPLVPLCRADCAGLCPTCGADLNTGACPGHPSDEEGPLAGLRELLETQE